MADKKVKEAELEDVKEQEKQKAILDYTTMLDDVRIMKAMTDTQAWQKFVRDIHNKIRVHAAALLDAEKPREVVEHQMGVKTLREMLNYPACPVDTLNHFVNNMPLFAQEMPVRARYNRDLGTIELTDVG